MDSRDLLEITLEACPRAIFIPAHIWTPHFSLFGAFSGFDTIEECFEDLTPHIHALETGLSSNPPMNWRLSALDGYTLVSNSDAHSPQKLGREANLLEIAPSYSAVKEAIEEKKFRPVGGEQDIHSDVRIVSAMNVDPITAVRDGLLRRDLFYRLGVVQLNIPPLREVLS